MLSTVLELVHEGVGVNKREIHFAEAIRFLGTMNVPTQGASSLPSSMLLPLPSPVVPPSILDLHSARDVVWAHGVNCFSALTAACNDPAVTVLEGDVIFGVRGEPVMGHNPGKADSDSLPLEQWLSAAAAAGKGVKVDVKEYDALPGVLRALLAHAAGTAPILSFPLPDGQHLSRPAVFLNADVLSTKSCPCTFNATRATMSAMEQIAVVRALIDVIGGELPAVIMSPGWTTRGEDLRYTEADVDAMLEAVGDVAALGVALTFPVRGSWVRRSWPALQVRT